MSSDAEVLQADELPVSSERTRLSMLDAPPVSSKGAQALAALGTAAVHAALVAFAVLVGVRGVAEPRRSVPVTEMIEVDLPAPPPAPEPAPKKSEPRPVHRRATEATSKAPPPAAAQAGQVLPAAAELVDFGETFVAGTGTSYAGGVTEKGGTAQHAVRDSAARASGAPGGTGAPVKGDRSRAPQLAGGAVWDCPFPPEAEDAGIDDALVTLRVQVSEDGRVTSASASNDPGHGFGREARRCALNKRWAAGLDRAGNPTNAVALVNVRFNRSNGAAHVR